MSMASVSKTYFFVSWMTIVTFTECYAAQNFTLGNTEYVVPELMENETAYHQCYLDVVVHNSSSYKYGLANAVVTAISGVIGSDNVNYSQVNTSASGHACLPVVCESEVHVFVTKNGIRIPAFNKTMQQRFLPLGYVAYLEYNSEVIKFYAFAWGELGGRNGPVYRNSYKRNCIGATLDNFYMVFSYVSFPDKLYSTYPPATNLKAPNASYAWRYNNQKKTCFFKIGFKVESTSVKITTASFDDGSKTLLGIFETGPMYDVNAKETNMRAACIEFRCPAIDDETGDDLDTVIEGNITVPDKVLCKAINKKNGFFKANSTSFVTKYPLNNGDNFGSSDGIYANENPRIARAKCFTGREYLGNEYVMNVSTGNAFSYDCSVLSIVDTGFGK